MAKKEQKEVENKKVNTKNKSVGSKVNEVKKESSKTNSSKSKANTKNIGSTAKKAVVKSGTKTVTKKANSSKTNKEKITIKNINAKPKENLESNLSFHDEKEEILAKNNIDSISADTSLKEEEKDIVLEEKQEQQKEDLLVPVNSKKNKNHFGLFEVIVLIVVSALIFSLIGYFIGNRENKSTSDYSTASKEIQTFIEEYNYILENYYGDIDKEKLISNAIKGMLSSLDEYSQFVGEESNNFSITLEGTYEGVGIAISNDENGNIVIREVYDNTPANRSGLKAGDIITKFNDTALKNVNSSDLVSMISNVKTMKLTILRDKKELVFDITKENVILDSVHSEMKENNVGYIQVSIFANNTYEQFKKALTELEQQGMKSLIIDLRGNSGGHLSSVEKMLYLFLDQTHVIYQTEDKNGSTKFYSKGKEDKKYPIVILQNLSSASASEIMASTLREELGAYIIGNTSYGKGTVQELQTVNGIGQYKFTTKKWLTPKGEWINGVGVVPDLEVSLTIEYLQNPTLENDAQYQAALEYLKK